MVTQGRGNVDNSEEELFLWFKQNLNELHAEFVRKMLENKTYSMIFSSQVELEHEDEKFTAPITLMYAIGHEAVALNNFAKIHMLINEEAKD